MIGHCLGMPDTQAEKQQSGQAADDQIQQSPSDPSQEDKETAPSQPDPEKTDRGGEESSQGEGGHWVWVPGRSDQAADNYPDTDEDNEQRDEDVDEKEDTSDTQRLLKEKTASEAPEQQKEQSPQQPPSLPAEKASTPQQLGQQNSIREDRDTTSPRSEPEEAGQSDEGIDRGEGGYWVWVPDAVQGTGDDFGGGDFYGGESDDQAETREGGTIENTEKNTEGNTNAQQAPDQASPQKASEEQKQQPPQQQQSSPAQPQQQFQPFQQPAQQSLQQPNSNDENKAREPQSDPAQEDQQRSNELQRQRELDRGTVRNQEAENDSDSEEGEGEEGAEGQDEERKQQLPTRQPKPLSLYFLLGFIAVLIDVVIPLIGVGIFTVPISFALALIFKVLGYFFLPKAKELKDRVLDFWLPAGADSVLDILPGNIAIVAFAFFRDYKEKILKIASFAAKFAGPEAKAAVEVAKNVSQAIDSAEGEMQGQNNGSTTPSRWRPPRLEGMRNLPGVAQADNKNVKKAA